MLQRAIYMFETRIWNPSTCNNNTWWYGTRKHTVSQCEERYNLKVLMWYAKCWRICNQPLAWRCHIFCMLLTFGLMKQMSNLENVTVQNTASVLIFLLSIQNCLILLLQCIFMDFILYTEDANYLRLVQWTFFSLLWCYENITVPSFFICMFLGNL
jgi:hypothetical protein